MTEYSRFYSKNWLQKNAIDFTIYTRAHFDISIDSDTLYLIKLPSYNPRIPVILLFGWWASFYSDSVRKTKIENYRSSWIDPSGAVISNNFEKDIFLKFSLVDLPKYLTYRKNGTISDGLIFNYDNNKLVLQNSKEECNQLIDYLNGVGTQIKIDTSSHFALN